MWSRRESKGVKTAEDFDRETAIIWLDNITLEFKVNDIKEDILVLNEMVHGLQEKLKEENQSG